MYINVHIEYQKIGSAFPCICGGEWEDFEKFTI